ncbi:MAG TPA: ATP-binding protein [Nocardioidaceae bacterium]|nr:ATP-binding protein [Nocardioidaceae bacterium]
MPSGSAARTSTGVTVSIARDPALVRTVRLVAAAVARRTGRDEEFVEEVRLAVGEACALLVGEVGLDGPVRGTDPVTVAIRIDGELAVDVTSTAPIDVEDPPHSDIDGVEPWALLRGLIDDFTVVQDGVRTKVSMCWPAA